MVACGSDVKTTSKDSNYVNKVSLATGGCYGTCPLMAVEIDSTLSFKYYGGRYSDKKGYFKGTVTQGFWDTLNIKFQKLNLEKLDTLFNSTLDDMTIESYFILKQTKRSLSGQEMSFPDSVREVLKWVMNSYKSQSLTSIDTLTFDTKIQYGFEFIPPPTKRKFKPPKLRN
jgi:hypothetical protein